MNIGLLFMLLGMFLSIVKENNWFIVPVFCSAFCWVVGIYYVFIYSFSKTMAHIIISEINSSTTLDEDTKDNAVNFVSKILKVKT